MTGGTVGDRVGGSYARVRASPGAVFVIVNYTERNDGAETRTAMGSPFTLDDQHGHTFRPATRAETALAMSGRHADPFPQLQPGIAHQATTVFEVPDTIRSAALVVHERGFDGARIGIVNINVPAHVREYDEE